MEPFLIAGFFCFAPLLLVVFGYWLGKGAPGWPWAVVRRDYTDEDGQRTSPYRGDTNYARNG